LRITPRNDVDRHAEEECLDALVVRGGMKLMRMAVLAGVAKKVYDESRKPENQARIRSAVDQVKARRGRR